MGNRFNCKSEFIITPTRLVLWQDFRLRKFRSNHFDRSIEIDRDSIL
ncbi:hypothetical protein LEP1GSC047_4176 [Leptospira inadai serovar Lyme str. 10]|uniref:Uncharacterized protein n=1 Tax=Leptospira inadai serovar Lyme str. 10 TaxID=1049790 RepID=V6HYQ2_9LEPT|nr:hypothetical protein LEP1GSC047_4176 [Leptospira inadai serovar Lyme str. 10]